MDMLSSSYDDYDYSYYPPPPPNYPPYNDQYYGGGGYGGGDDDSDNADDRDEGRDDDSGNDDGDDSGNDGDGDDSGDDDDGDDCGEDDDGDDSSDDDGNDNDSEEDSSEENNTSNFCGCTDSGGTTNIGVIHGEDMILAVDSRATEMASTGFSLFLYLLSLPFIFSERDGKKKMIKLTESIVLTRVGKVGVSKAIWKHLKEKLRETSTYLTIEELANSGKEFADTITDDASGKCFIGGIEGRHPILYSFGYHYDKVLRSGRGFLDKIEKFLTMGSGRVYARRAYENEMARRGSGVSIDDVKEEVTFALLKAAVEDVAQVSPTIGYQVTSINSIDSYVRFFDRLGATNQRPVLAVYPRNQKSTVDDLEFDFRANVYLSIYHCELAMKCTRFMLQDVQ
ncbi:hypothetical protein PS2_043117 [Malus domestica]